MAIEIYSTDTDAGQLSVLRQVGKKYEVIGKIKVGNAPRGAVKL
jgi:hypothetical protein